MAIDVILVVALVAAAMTTDMMPRMLWSVISLAMTSIVVTLWMFRLDAPIAAVFELSVCACLIPAVFITAIGLTKRLTPEALAVRATEKLKQYWLLPVIVVFVGIVLTQVRIPLDFALPPESGTTSVREVLWLARQLDLVGQIVILLGGGFGVAVLFKDVSNE